jgi:ribosomal protein L29
MKKKDLNELKTKSILELEKKFKEKQSEKIVIQMEHKLGKIKNVHQIGSMKKELAKILTFIRLKEIKAISDKKEIKEAANG